MRRAGFGATRGELEAMVEQGYEETVERLLDAESEPEIDWYSTARYLPQMDDPQNLTHAQLIWLHRMVRTTSPLREKMALFWHHVFATGQSKVENVDEMLAHIDLFRRQGLGSYRDLLVELAKSPAMVRWLDNNDNHKRAPNENWGRELLELFSLGVGNYTEDDIYECARAFTGWTFYGFGKGPIWGGPLRWLFDYRPEDHDGGEKRFLGHIGRFDGEDIIDIAVRQPACATFVSRHLYNFFVADEPQIPAWPIEPARDPEAITTLSTALVESGYEMKPVLRTLFNADFFKESMYQKVKNPAEVVAGTLRLTGEMQEPAPQWIAIAKQAGTMGQSLLDPPSVEGWHTGKEWINSGAFINRVNFVADRVRDPGLAGVKEIIDRIGANGKMMSADELIDRCLDLMGPLEIKDKTRQELFQHVEKRGPVSTEASDDFSRRVGDVLALIAGTREYQFG